MNILITGACGHLGSGICRYLAEHTEHTLRATDVRLRKDMPVRVQVATLMDREVCYGLCEDIDAILHLGNHNIAWKGTPQYIFGENVTMNMNLFQAAAERGVRRIVFASSIQVIAGQRTLASETPSILKYLPIDSDTPAQPGNPYALSKHMGEHMLRYFHEVHALDSIALRLPTTHDWFHIVLRDGLASGRSYLEAFPENVQIDEAMTLLSRADANDLFLRCLETDLPGARLYQPASPQPLYSNLATAEIIQRYFPDVPLKQPLDQIAALCDTSKITEELGWAPSPDVQWKDPHAD
ncbi:MAG: NAD-dependent epimerase/dehydratase family protein [Opitutales bacterium]